MRGTDQTAGEPLQIMRDPRVRAVQWRDLSRLSKGEAARELALPLPWLALELWLAASGHLTLAAAAAFMFFLACLRVAHDVFHGNLRLPRWLDHAVLAVMSPLMFASLHAVRLTHLRHHVHCLDDGDVEAASARATAVRALLCGPLYAVRTHCDAFARASAWQRCQILAELASCAAAAVAALTLFRHTAIAAHVAMMAVGQCLAPFFAVWTVHHDCDRSHFIARTLRNRIKSIIVLDMFFHVEHHLFPGVPTKRLPELAQRLDVAAPELATRQVY